jgi:hypothetical protein
MTKKNAVLKQEMINAEVMLYVQVNLRYATREFTA